MAIHGQTARLLVRLQAPGDFYHPVLGWGGGRDKNALAAAYEPKKITGTFC